eukprot:13036914-Heterocapsa_arctica.AAC.1
MTVQMPSGKHLPAAKPTSWNHSELIRATLEATGGDVSRASWAWPTVGRAVEAMQWLPPRPVTAGLCTSRKELRRRGRLD